MRFSLFIVFLIFAFATAAAHPRIYSFQVDTTAHPHTDTLRTRRDTLKKAANTHTVKSTAPDTTRKQKKPTPSGPKGQNLRITSKPPAKPSFQVKPMAYFEEPGFNLISDDSLQRWHYWQTPLDWESRYYGTIAYRLGSIGSNNGIMVKGHEDRFSRVYLDDYLLNNPVGGSFNYNILPKYFINTWYQDANGINVISRFRTQDFLVDKPLTRADYAQTSGGYKTLDALITRNIGQRLNIIGVYWTQGADGEYLNSQFSGRQAYGRITYRINHSIMWKTSVLYNGLSKQQPDGYRISDMSTFNFDALNTSAIRGGSGLGNSPAKSSSYLTLYRTTFYMRRDTLHKANLELGGFYHIYRRFFRAGADSILGQNGNYTNYPADSMYYKVRKIGAYVRKTFDLGPALLDVRASANRFRIDHTTNRSLTKNLWTTYRLEGRNEWKFMKYAKLNLMAYQVYRSDQFSERSAKAQLDLPLFHTVTLKGALSAGSYMPTIQELYWKPAIFSGNRNLKNERVERADAGLQLTLTKTTNLGVDIYGSMHHDPIALAADSTFKNIGLYQSLGADAWFRINSFHWEFDLSTTWQKFASTSSQYENKLLTQGGYRVWNRAGIFWKGYVLNDAAFIKTGFYGVMAPFNYHTAHYYPSLDLWQFVNTDPEIPSFYNIDFDLTARVRWFFLYFRLENVTQGLGRAGYFETAYYPMSSRRLIFGIRVIFRN